MTEWNTVLVYQTPDYVTPQAKKDAKQTGSTEHYPDLRRPARSSGQHVEGPMLSADAVEPPLHPPRQDRAAAMEVDQQQYEIGAPDSQAIPPPTSAGDWEHDKEMLEDMLNLLMPGAAPTRSCAKCLWGELVLNWLEDKKGYIWICQRGDPDCELVWTDKIRWQPSR